MKIFLLLALLIFKTTVFSNEIYIASDLSESLGSLYDNNPKINMKEKFLNLRMNYYLELFLILDQKYQVIIKKVKLIQSLKDLILLQTVSEQKLIKASLSHKVFLTEEVV